MKLAVGQKLVYDFTVAEEDIAKFAELSGDHQRIHTDNEVAKRTIFGRKVAPGFLTVLPVSKILGENVIDEKEEYLLLVELENLKWLAPVYPNNQVFLELFLKDEPKKGHFLFSVTWWKTKEDDSKVVVVTAEIRTVIKKFKD